MPDRPALAPGGFRQPAEWTTPDPLVSKGEREDVRETMARHLNFERADKRKRPYWREERVLGKTITDKQNQAVLVIGKDQWTRQEMIEQLRCGNFQAAANLSKIAHKLQVDSLKQLTGKHSMEDLFAERGCGVMTMFVLMCAQEARGRDPIAYLHRKPDEIVTLSTEKHRVVKQLAASA